MNVGQRMYDMAARLFPICRSITGDGFRQSLEIIRATVPGISVSEVPSGTQVFDWTVPREWNIRGGWIRNMKGETIIENLYFDGTDKRYYLTANQIIRQGYCAFTYQEIDMSGELVETAEKK